MKLSHAIREGSKLYRQCTNGMLECRDDHGNLYLCAIGMAGHYFWEHGISWTQKLDEIQEIKADCPMIGCWNCNMSLPVAIIHLNDFHKMSPEYIAKFVESVEREELEFPSVEPMEPVYA